MAFIYTCVTGRVRDMLIVDRTQFLKWREEGYRFIPIIKKIRIDMVDISEVFHRLSGQDACGILLESGMAGEYSYFAWQPEGEIIGKNGSVTIRSFNSDIGEEIFRFQKEGDEASSLSILEKWMDQYRAPHVEDGPDWQGGLAGYLSYDVIRDIEEIPRMAQDDLALPDFYFYVCNRLVAYHHPTKTIYIIRGTMYDDKYDDLVLELEEIERQLLSVIESTDEGREQGQTDLFPFKNHTYALQDKPVRWETAFEKERFIDAVKKVQQYIRSGDVFQVNLSVRQHTTLRTEPWEIYRQLRRFNPSPYMGYLRFRDLELVSGSPELLVKVKGNRISTRPIAGTRPRGEDPEEDARLAKELIDHEKERAEHIMLVDLERNDLGKVCRYGTVEVNELMVIEEYSHVMHIVSNVQGELRDDCGPFDVIRAVFPGGTITGAPKIRTMEIIEELEPVTRGPYTGSMGWIGFDRDMELNIIIRTLVAKDGTGYVQAGAGIVIDSIPDAEYAESLQKAKALWQAVEWSEKTVEKEQRRDEQ